MFLKKLLLILLCIPLIGFGQSKQNDLNLMTIKNIRWEEYLELMTRSKNNKVILFSDELPIIISGEHRDTTTMLYLYKGEYNKDGEKHGKGTCTLRSGARYVGEWKNGKQNGEGTYTAPDGKVYNGLFKNGEFIEE